MTQKLPIILITILLITVSTVYGVGEITVNELTLGGTSQDRSNPKADNVQDRITNVTGTMTFTNNGNSSLTGISVNLANLPSKFTPAITTAAPTTLAANTQGSFGITLKVPEDLSAFERLRANPNNDRRQLVGTVTITGTLGNATVTGTGNLYMEAENQLTIENVKIIINDKSKNVDDNDNVDVRPGDTVTLLVEVKNGFSKSGAEDLEIEDVEVSIDIDDDGDFDIDENTLEYGDLGPRDKEEETTIIKIELDADDDPHDVTLLLTGTDENKAKHGEKLTFTLDIKRKRHEIKIQDISVRSPTCTSRSAEVTVNLLNIGKEDEDEVSVKVEVPEIDHRDRRYDLELDENDDFTESFRIPIADTVNAGTYEVIVESYYGRTSLSDSDAALIDVPTCAVAVPPPVPQPAPEPTPVPQPTPPETVEPEQEVFNTDTYLWALAIIIVVLILAVIGLTVKFIVGKE